MPVPGMAQKPAHILLFLYGHTQKFAQFVLRPPDCLLQPGNFILAEQIDQRGHVFGQGFAGFIYFCHESSVQRALENHIVHIPEQPAKAWFKRIVEKMRGAPKPGYLVALLHFPEHGVWLAYRRFTQDLPCRHIALVTHEHHGQGMAHIFIVPGFDVFRHLMRGAAFCRPLGHQVWIIRPCAPFQLETQDALIYPQAKIDEMLAGLSGTGDHFREKQVMGMGNIISAGMRAQNIACEKPGAVVEQKTGHEFAVLVPGIEKTQIGIFGAHGLRGFGIKFAHTRMHWAGAAFLQKFGP